MPARGWPRYRALLARSAQRRCPLCGAPGIWKGWYDLRDRCPRCGYEFVREGGYFLGAYVLNLIAAEFIPVFIFIGLFVWTDLSWIWMEIILIPLVIGLPFLLFPYSRLFWMALDLVFTPVNQR